jgi:His/Glu/Gln/Arg/opine family amino acid ABC transporter permease subunit
VSFLGIVLATILGVIVGVARLSKNILVQGLARAYIEVLRNIPLLVMLIFWYTGLFLKLPRVNQATPGRAAFYRPIGDRYRGDADRFDLLIVLAAGLSGRGDGVCLLSNRSADRAGTAGLGMVAIRVPASGRDRLAGAADRAFEPGCSCAARAANRGRQAVDTGVHGAALRAGHLYVRIHRGCCAAGIQAVPKGRLKAPRRSV